MKKLLLLILGVFCIMSATSCSSIFGNDTEHAAITITTSSGNGFSCSTYTAEDDLLLGKSSGEDLASKDPIIVPIGESETVDACFYCSKCGFRKHFEFDSYGSEIISCDCPEEVNESGNSKEFACIIICKAPDISKNNSK